MVSFVSLLPWVHHPKRADWNVLVLLGHFVGWLFAVVVVTHFRMCFAHQN
jgi:hypothetical protein